MHDYINVLGGFDKEVFRGNFVLDPSTPKSLSGITGIAVDNTIYVATGAQVTAATAATFSYDTLTKTYDVTLPNAPWPGYLGSLVRHGDYLYLYGGRPV